MFIAPGSLAIPLRQERHVNWAPTAHGAPLERLALRGVRAINILLLRSKDFDINEGDFSCKAQVRRQGSEGQYSCLIPKFASLHFSTMTISEVSVQ